MEIGDRLKKYRTTKNLTQDDLAVIIGISRQQLGKYEGGHSYPGLKYLEKLLQHDTELQYKWLVNGEEPMFISIDVSNSNSIDFYKERIKELEKTITNQNEYIDLLKKNIR